MLHKQRVGVWYGVNMVVEVVYFTPTYAHLLMILVIIFIFYPYTYRAYTKEWCGFKSE